MPGSMRTPLEFFIILVVILNLAIVIVCFVIDANLTGRNLGHNKEVRLLVSFLFEMFTSCRCLRYASRNLEGEKRYIYESCTFFVPVHSYGSA